MVVDVLWVELCCALSLVSVVIWSDVLGGGDVWRSPLCWCSCCNTVERAPFWTQTGQTQ